MQSKKITHCRNNSKIKYQNGRERDKFDTPNTQIHDVTPNTQICESAFSWPSI